MPLASEVASELSPAESAQMRHAAFVADVCFALATGTPYPSREMKTYLVTFAGFNGTRPKSVRVEARNRYEAEGIARDQNPGWLTVEEVRAA